VEEWVEDFISEHVSGNGKDGKKDD
jgi:hypothetical protein